MNEEKNNKRMFYVIMGIALTLVLGIGISFAVFSAQANRNVNLVTTGTLQIRYTEGSTITADNLKPATVEQVKKAYTHGSCVFEGDRTAGFTTEKICAYKTFTITNIGSLTAYTNVILEDVTNTYQNLKYQLFETTPATLSGINLLNTTELVNNIELLPNGNKTYTLLIWLDESATIETDQNKSYTAKITASAKTSNETGNNTPNTPTGLEEPSNANRPVLADGMIPVIHNGTQWVKANATGDYNEWYDYGNKQWANAVMVSSATRDTYMTADVGTPVQEADILAYYVWIPRYKYQLFNIEFDGAEITETSAIINENNAINTLEYKNDITIHLNQVDLNGYEQLINVVFEKGTETTGTVRCSTSEIGVETCTNKANGNWYTHPAFTFGTGDLKGIWVGKFETTYGTNTDYVDPGNVVYETPTIKPNVTSLRNQQVSKQFQTAQYFGTSAYLTNTGVNEVDAHMMKNIEWGAVAYLKQSAYGLGTTDITLNSNYDNLTGCGPQSAGSTSSDSTCNAYDTTLGMSVSTTGNITGVYDMSGGAEEYTMGVIQDNTTTSRSPMSGYNTDSNSGYIGKVESSYANSGNTLAFPAAKYYDLYAHGTTDVDQTAYNRSHLGDATGETRSWYSDKANFPYARYPWFRRGGSYFDGSDAGVFYFHRGRGDANTDYGFRVALSTTGA